MTKDGTPKRIGDVGAVDDVLLPIHKPLDHMGEPYLILAYEVKHSPDGDWFLINAVHEETAEEILLSCGSFMVMKQLEYLDPVDDFPVIGKFIKRDRTYYLGDVDE